MFRPGWQVARGHASTLKIDLGDLVRSVAMHSPPLCNFVSATNMQGSVRTAISALTSYDAVVLNAGIAPQETQLTPQGLESAFQVNYLSHYYLLREMLQRKLLGAGSHVVVRIWIFFC